MSDAFTKNILGALSLVNDDTNKLLTQDQVEEGVIGDPEDVFKLSMSDEELLSLDRQWVNKNNPYNAKIKPRQDKNKVYYRGIQNSTGSDQVVTNNLLFEAEETFIPQALSKNPEPVVWSDNTEEGKNASNDVKTMLQYHSDVLCLRKVLGVMVRHWSIYFLGVVKHGYSLKSNDITLDIRKPQNFILDPDGYIDVYGNFIGAFLGEKIECSAKELVERFPKHKEDITLKVGEDKMGTLVVYKEWWTDEYCFTVFGEKVLDKHKNELFNYDVAEKKDEEGNITQTATPGVNHFATPKMPYTFLSVFSLQEQPHDITNLIEQNISNQQSITDRDFQIAKNLATNNNSIALSGLAFDVETATEAAMALENGDPVLVPNGDVNNGIKRFPASDVPNGVFEAQRNAMDNLRSIFGTQGLSSQPQNEDTTARGMILNQSHDSSRIGGGIGDALEQVADNIFNWWLQLYCVFYDEAHYASIMGSDQAVEYVTMINTNLTRNFVVSVAPNSMQPKDEVTEQNLAIQLAEGGWLDPITLFKKLNYPDPMEVAKQVTIFRTNPQLYMQMFFPESAPQQQPMGVAPPEGGGAQVPPESSGTLAAPPASASLSSVPISTNAFPK